jgi:hypothetical protein
VGKPHNPPWRHHYIPEFYSRWWTGEDGKLERYTQPRPGKMSVRRVFPSEVGWARNLYLSPGENPGESQTLELNFFSKLDNAAAPVLTALNEAGPPALDRNGLSTWSTFIMSLLRRTPANLAATKETGWRQWAAMVPLIEERFRLETGRNVDPEALRHVVEEMDRGGVDRTVMWALPNLMMSPRIGRFINNLHWTVVDLPPGAPSLLLSDDPLARTNGLARPGGHMAMPISPRRLLLLAWDLTVLDAVRQAGARELARNMNKWVVEGARHFVAAQDRSQTRFIANRFGRDPKFGIGRKGGPEHDG